MNPAGSIYTFASMWLLKIVKHGTFEGPALDARFACAAEFTEGSSETCIQAKSPLPTNEAHVCLRLNVI